VRDYIHVVDLADGHAAALKKLSDPGIGTSLLPFSESGIVTMFLFSCRFVGMRCWVLMISYVVF